MTHPTIKGLEPNETAEMIRVSSNGQEQALISYTFKHTSGREFACEAYSLAVCRHEKDLWLWRNELEKVKKQRKRKEDELRDDTDGRPDKG